MKVTLSVIKADVGGFTGHSGMHPDIILTAEDLLEEARDEGKIIDYYVGHVGDDLVLVLTHQKFIEDPEIHGMAWNVFKECAEVAKELGLYGAGQDLLKDTFSGNLKGMGPGFAEMSFEERPSEPVVIFAADKTEPGAWNYPLFKIFADPFNTAGLVFDPSLHQGFVFEVHDIIKHRKVRMATPEEMYDLLALIGQVGRYVIKTVFRKDGEVAAVTSTERLNLIAGKYVGKDDPVMVVRAQHGFPAQGEILEPFAFPHLVAGWMRGSHWGPLMPVPFRDARATRFDGPPRVIAMGFQLKDGILEGPVDLFDDPAFDRARNMANAVADFIRRHGPFEPHRLPESEMEYTTLPEILKKLEGRFEPL